MVATGTNGEAGVDLDDNVLRISRQHNAPFYLRAGTNFLQGVTGKDGVEKKVFETIVVSALGAAIPIAATVTGLLEKNGAGTVTKIETGYTKLEFGQRPNILVTVKRNPDYVAPPKKERGSGKAPECPERLNDEKLEKKMKKVLKEGGKRGVEIEGAADMGGLKYFCTKVLEPAGDLDMLVESMKAMNAKSDPTEEERKGGAGHVGKVICSFHEENSECKAITICAYVPAAEQGDITAKDWLEAVLLQCGAAAVQLREDSNAMYAQCTIKNDGEKGIFCLKIRDYVVQHSMGHLKSKGLVPDLDDEDDDEMVFGDDDFP